MILMESCVRNEGTLSQFPYLCSLYSSISKQPQPVLCRRPHMPSVFIYSHPETHHGWMQDMAGTPEGITMELCLAASLVVAAMNALPLRSYSQ